MKKFWIDILKTKDPEKCGEENFSQSRVYLLVSLITLFIFLYADFFWGYAGDNFEFIINTLFYVMGFFGSYALFKKGMSHGENWKRFSAQHKDKVKDN